MPNHIHGIIIINYIVGNAGMVGNARVRSLQPTYIKHLHMGKYKYDRTKMLIPKIIQWFKSETMKKINHQNNNYYFRWQKSYYDHIIRNDHEMNIIRKYIMDNPKNWDKDRNYKMNYMEIEI